MADYADIFIDFMVDLSLVLLTDPVTDIAGPDNPVFLIAPGTRIPMLVYVYVVTFLADIPVIAIGEFVATKFASWYQAGKFYGVWIFFWFFEWIPV